MDVVNAWFQMPISQLPVWQFVIILGLVVAIFSR